MSSKSRSVYRRFVISGIVDPAEVQRLQQLIEKLGGTIEDRKRNYYAVLCTHVLVGSFCLTEKIIGGLAGGKWLVSVDYVTDSVKEGRWLPEVKYEITQLNGCAKYCRQKRYTRGFGIYSGWNVYVNLGNIEMTKSFRRVMAAGDANIATVDEMFKVDLLVCDKSVSKEIRKAAGPTIPMVSINYLKSTLCMRADPTDLRPFLLDDVGKYKLTYVVDVEQDIYNRGFKRPLAERPLVANKKSYPAQKNETPEVVDIVSPKESSLSVCSAPSKHSKRKYLSIPFTPNRHASMYRYLIKRDLKRNESQETDSKKESSDDVEIVSEVVKSSRVGARIMITGEAPPVESDDCFITKVESKPNASAPIRMIGNFFTDEQRAWFKKRQQEVLEMQKKETSPIKGALKDKSPQKKVHTKSLTSGVDSTGCRWKLKKLSVNLGVRVDEDWERLNKGISNKVLLGDRSTKELSSVKLSPLKQPNRDTRVRKSNIPIEVTHEPLHKKFEIDRKYLKGGLLKFISERKTITGIDWHELNPRSVKDFKSKSDSGDDASDSSTDDESAVDNAHLAVRSQRSRELAVDEYAFYEGCVTEKQNLDILWLGISSLVLYMSPYAYPPDFIFAIHLKQLVLEAEDGLIHTRALEVAYRMLAFHPPSNAKMRRYYLRVFEMVMMNEMDVTSLPPPWTLLRYLLETLHPEEDSLGDACTEVEMRRKSSNALNLLQFVVAALREDIKGYSSRMALKLMSWRMFWGSSYQNPSYLTSPVKQLIKYWVSLATASRAIRRCVANLVSIMMELAWRYERPMLVPVTSPPECMKSIANEVYLRVKESKNQPLLQLLYDLPSAWQRMIFLTMLFPRLAHVNRTIKIHLKDLIHLVYSKPWIDGTINEFKSPAVSPKKEKKCDSTDEETASPKKKLLNPKLINKRNGKGETPLIIACIKNDVEQVRHLLTYPEIDVNVSDYSGWTALHEASMRGFTDCVRVLLDYCGPPRSSSKSKQNSPQKHDRKYYRTNIRPKGGDEHRTPLHDAVENEHKDTAQLLLEYGGGDLLHDKLQDGKTPLNLALDSDMKNFLKTYRGKPPSKGPLYDAKKYDNAPNEDIARINHLDFLPVQKDRTNFMLTYLNCYIHTTGLNYFRHLLFQDYNDFLQKKKASRKKSSDPQVQDSHCSTVETVAGSSSSKSTCQNVCKNSDLGSEKNKLDSSTSSNSVKSSVENVVLSSSVIMEPDRINAAECEQALAEELRRPLDSDLRVMFAHQEELKKSADEETEPFKNSVVRFLFT